MEPETFYNRVKKATSGTLFLSIPRDLAKFANIVEGDYLKVTVVQQHNPKSNQKAEDKQERD